MARFRFAAIVKGQEQERLPFTVRDGYEVEFFSPDVAFNPLLGVDVVRSGSGIKPRGVGILTNVSLEITVSWPGSVTITPYLIDESGRIWNGVGTTLTAPTGKRVVNSGPELFGLARWGELYWLHGIRLSFSGSGEGVLNGAAVVMTVTPVSTVTIVGGNMAL